MFAIIGISSQAISQPLAKKLSEQLDTVKQEWNSSIETVDSVNLNIPLSDYYTQHYRAIASYTLQYFDFLQELNLQTEGIELSGKLEEGLFLWQKSTALLSKIQILDKKAKALAGLKRYTSGIQLLSDRRLIIEQYEFLNFVEWKYNELQLAKLAPLKEIIFQQIGLLEGEMKKRNLYPSKVTPLTSELLQRRYQLIKEFEATVIEEAYSLGDASPEIAFQRQKLIDIVQEINTINKRLGIRDIKPTELLREKIIQKRIGILKYAYQEVLKKHHLQMHLNTEVKQHLRIIDEILVIEKQELYKVQSAELLNITPRPPPFPTATDIFSPSPLPLLPDNGKLGLSLHEFFSEQDIAKADVKGAQKAQKSIQRVVEKLYALAPSLKIESFPAHRISRNSKKSDIPSIRDELGILSNRAYDAVTSGNIQKGEFYKRKFEAYQDEVLGKVAFSTSDFFSIEEKEQTLARLKVLKQNLEKEKATGGAPFIRPTTDHEIQVVEELISGFNKNGTSDARKVAEELGELLTRPPPSTELLAQKLLDQNLRIGEKIHAIYGTNTNPSINYLYKENVQTKAIKESTNLLTAVNEYLMAGNPALIKLIQSLPPEMIEQLKLEKDLKQINEQAQFLSDKVNRTLAKDNSLTAGIELPQGIATELKKAQKALPPPKNVLDKQDIYWRPNQSLEKIKSMVDTKDPGGIWLTPGKQLVVRPANNSQELWLIVLLEETCPDESEYGQWVISDTEKVCFTDTDFTHEKKHWLYQIKPWK